MPRVYQARVVFPVDSPPIEHGVVTVADGRIVAIGKADSAGARTDKLTDLGDVALVPGLVNAHAHLEFSHLQRPLGRPGMRLADWIRLVIAERQGRPQTPAAAITAGLSESQACGVTTVGEIATGEAAAYDADSPIDLTLLVEVIGFSRARAVSVIAATTERLKTMRLSLFAKATLAKLAKVHLGVSPHAPYTVSSELLGWLVALAEDHRMPVAMHLAESRDELELLSAGTGPLQALLDERSMWDSSAIPRGTRPLDYLKLLALAPRVLVVHGNYLDAAERAFMAKHAESMSLVYCPRTHTYFQHETYPLAELLAAGVRVAVGTDSRASNPDLSVLGELRHIARVHSEIAPSAVLRLGALAGAEALGRAADVGSLTPGKRAELLAIPLPAGAVGKPEDLLAAMLSGEERGTRIE